MIIALTVPFSFAIMAILAALIRPSDAGSYDSAFALLVVATIIMIPIMAATGQLWMFSGAMSVGDWALIIYMVINAGFYVVLYEVVRLAGPVFFSSGNFIATLSGVIWAILVFGEIPSYWIWVALVLLSLGLFLVNRSNVQQSKREG
jgi:drug/metabolite transporter (DMT)-like permease